jgi:hypothetical protein
VGITFRRPIFAGVTPQDSETFLDCIVRYLMRGGCMIRLSCHQS